VLDFNRPVLLFSFSKSLDKNNYWNINAADNYWLEVSFDRQINRITNMSIGGDKETAILHTFLYN
jgi:hypothetical protein